MDLGWDAGLAARIDTIEALGKLGDERAIPCLIVALYEGDESARIAAVDALGRLGSERAESALTALLNRSNSESVMTAAIRTIRRIRGDKPLVSLKEQLASSMSEERIVSVRLEDLCHIAEAMGTMVHDLGNGKTKYLRIELAKIHDVVLEDLRIELAKIHDAKFTIEKWVADEEVLGGGCHEHRCRLCRESGRVW